LTVAAPVGRAEDETGTDAVALTAGESEFDAEGDFDNDSEAVDVDDDSSVAVVSTVADKVDAPAFVFAVDGDGVVKGAIARSSASATHTRSGGITRGCLAPRGGVRRRARRRAALALASV